MDENRLISADKLKRAIAIAEQIEELEEELKQILSGAITSGITVGQAASGSRTLEDDLDPEDRLRIEDYLKAKGRKQPPVSRSRVGGLASGKMGADIARR